MRITIEISPGELIDRLSILQLKKIKIHDKEKLKNIYYQLDNIFWPKYQNLLISCKDYKDEIARTYLDLSLVNTDIWNLEDKLRNSIKFLSTDRHGYVVTNARLDMSTTAAEIANKNDERAEIKRRIDTLLGSILIEEKSHKNL